MCYTSGTTGRPRGVVYSHRAIYLHTLVAVPVLDFRESDVVLPVVPPTIWLGILQLLDKDPGAYDLSSLRRLLVGGSAAPQSMIEGFEKRHGLEVLHLWGMTETTPLGTVSTLSPERREAPQEEQFATRAKQGRGHSGGSSQVGRATARRRGPEGRRNGDHG